MKTLWTPWRMEHVTGMGPALEGCLFEPPGEGSCDKPRLLLYRRDDGVVLLNRYPYANGHLLVAPRRHVATLGELSGEENHALFDLVSAATAILERGLAPDGLNIGINIGTCAGAGIADHLHVHVVPRWRDDHNFMTVLAEIRAIPEHLEATYDKLLPDFQRLAARPRR